MSKEKSEQKSQFNDSGTQHKEVCVIYAQTVAAADSNVLTMANQLK